MSFMSEEGRGDSVVLAKGRQVVTIVAAFFAVIALVLSVLVMMPTAHAVTVEDSEETSTTQESPDGAPAADDEESQPATTTPAESGQAPAGGEPKPIDPNRPFRNTGSPKNWANEYIESVDVYRFGSDTPLTGPPANVTPMVEGTAMVFQVNWNALGKDEAAPGDVLHVDLPEWLKLSNTFDQPMANVGRCKGTAGSRQITCTFGERGPNVHVEKGYLKFTATAVKTQTAQAFKFGQVDVDAYYYFTGAKSGEVKGTVYNPENIGKDVTKGGQYSFEYNVAGKKYTQLVWNILIPKEKVNEIVDAGGAIEISDTLKPLTVTDPDTGKEVELPHYIAPMARGPFNVIRRSGESLERGTWSNNQEESKCQPGREYEQANIKCADKVYGNSGNTLKYFEGRQGEEVVFTGITPETTWDKGNTFTARITNPVRDSAYRIGFFSVVPADSLKLLSSKSPKVQNTAQVNGERIETKNGVSVYVKGEVDASTYTDSTNFVIKKEVLPNFQDSDIKEFKVRYTIGDKTSECTVAPGSDCRIEKVAPNTRVTLEELAVDGSRLKWQQGMFSHVNGGTNQTQVDIDGHQATINNPVPGERVVLLLTNRYDATKYGMFKIHKNIVNRPAELTGDSKFAVRYRCNANSKDNSVQANELQDVEIGADGQPVDTTEFPVGTECSVVEESTTTPQVPNYSFTPNFDTATVTISEEANANIATVTNVFKKDEAKFKVIKVISGDAGDAARAKNYEFDYDCGPNPEDKGTLTITGNGEAQPERTFPVGTRCTVTERGVDNEGAAWIANHDLTVTPVARQEVEVSADASVTFTNDYLVRKGKFNIIKRAEGEDGKASNVTFDFTYNCGGVQGTLQALGNGTPVESDREFPVGTKCDITEGISVALVDEYNDVTDVGERSKQITIGVGEVVSAEFENRYERKTGTFAVSKKVVADAGLVAPATYDFDYVCELGGKQIQGEILGVPANGSKESIQLPTGAVCTVTERNAPVIGASLVTEISGSAKITEGNKPEVIVSNTYTKDLGDFAIEKAVVDPDNVAADKTEFTFSYECVPPAGREAEEKLVGELVVQPGRSATSEKIPAGFICTLTEIGADVEDAKLVTTGLDSTLTVVKDGEPKNDALTVTNTYSQWRGTLQVAKRIAGTDAVA
ncbi:MAG: DUF5979 domain-containing protein [Corynebacterium sp.]|nr:DUF5979 domain-containing protein [Corynebacterium sp.]